MRMFLAEVGFDKLLVRESGCIQTISEDEMLDAATGADVEAGTWAHLQSDGGTHSKHCDG